MYSRRVVVPFHDFVSHAASLFVDFAKARAHKAFDAGDGLGWVCDGLALCRFSYFTLSTVDEGYHRWSCALAFAVVDDHGFVSFHHCNAAVGGSEVDANDFTHVARIDCVFVCFALLRPNLMPIRVVAWNTDILSKPTPFL